MNASSASPPWEPHEDSLPWEVLAAWRHERAARLRAEAALARERQAQEERERFFRVASDLFCVAGTDGTVHRINPAFATVLGWCEAQLVGRPFLELVHPEDRAAMLAELTRLSQDEHVALRFEHRCLCADGGYRWLSWTAHSLPEQRLIYAAARDITQDKRAEAQARMRADFEQKLIGIVSHDLRNPLGAILLGTQGLLRRADADPRAQRGLAHILSSTQRCLRMVRDLLDFTQARLGGGIRVQPRVLELHRLAEQTLEEVRLCHPQRQLRLRHEGEARGEWDADRLAQVLTNLVSNAVKYSPGDTPVEVTTRGGEDHVLLSVHNQGEPIPAGLRARLFEPMQRGEACADTSDRSVGLGLYIVKHLVEAHGGQVAVESTAPGGTRFTVRLPRRPAPPGPRLEH